LCAAAAKNPPFRIWKMDLADIRIDPDPGQHPNVMDFFFAGVNYLAKFGENPPMRYARKYH